MPSSTSEARALACVLAFVIVPMWACATAVDNSPVGTNPLASSGSEENQNFAGSDSASGGDAPSAAGSASAGKTGAIGGSGNGAGGAPASGGMPSSSGGKGSAGSGSTGHGGANTGGAGKGGSSVGGSSVGGSSVGGSSVGGSSVGGSSVGGSSGSSAGSTSTGGVTGSATCDAAHAVATLSGSYLGKANDCVRLAVNPTWSVVGIKLQAEQGTAVYPLTFSFFGCDGNGTGSLSADYTSFTLKAGPNPGCDYFVQFGGGATTIKVTYYD